MWLFLTYSWRNRDTKSEEPISQRGSLWESSEWKWAGDSQVAAFGECVGYLQLWVVFHVLALQAQHLCRLRKSQFKHLLCLTRMLIFICNISTVPAHNANIYTSTFRAIICSIINVISTICTATMKAPTRQGVLCQTLYKHKSKDSHGTVGLTI